MRSGIVTLTTDFGLDDAFVGVMKGVILARNPECRIVDLTHGIPPGNRMEAVLALASAHPFFPRGTVHAAVVDPGVGSDRRILAAEAAGHLFLAPDSGLIPAALDPFGDLPDPPRARYVSVEAQELFLPSVSSTFHGRDVYAPAAAGLALGLSIDALGPEIFDPVPFALRLPVPGDGGLRGEVIHVDRFGNLVTNIRAKDLPFRPWVVRIGDAEIVGPSGYYWSVRPGELLGLLGSGGLLEISVRDGSAAKRLGAGVGTPLAAASHAGGKEAGDGGRKAGKAKAAGGKSRKPARGRGERKKGRAGRG